MIPLLIADVAVRARTVQAPDKCPKCGASIVSPSGLKLVPIWAVGRIVLLNDEKVQTAHKEELHPVEWRCYECDAVVAAGKFHYTFVE